LEEGYKNPPETFVPGGNVQKNTPFLHTGLYRWFGNRTQSAGWIQPGRGLVRIAPPITASEEFHLAPKQTFFFYLVGRYAKTFCRISIHPHYIKATDKSQGLLYKIIVKN